MEFFTAMGSGQGRAVPRGLSCGPLSLPAALLLGHRPLRSPGRTPGSPRPEEKRGLTFTSQAGKEEVQRDPLRPPGGEPPVSLQEDPANSM